MYKIIDVCVDVCDAEKYKFENDFVCRNLRIFYVPQAVNLIPYSHFYLFFFAIGHTNS